ncbi:hypothetical protein GFB56_15635 [Ensifer sp. T173]|uniref:Uncharacterized protein n=1 Tax=Ensifer canadensis TaxID=555315 RepID=A0AAW4FJF4_9HYPH|nr:hypothetical protein [Ensifer canadensis]MBM3092235.1 hypothetical protein [Ensifer canadensis]UBI73959.1 hypothetical protein J3R84_10515 [Ensifer canadensis]
MRKVVLTLIFASQCLASGLNAAEVKREKIAQWGDPLTPPQSRTSCIGYASGDWPWGGGWKTCNEWKTEWRHMEVEAFLVVSGPDDLHDAAKKATEECIATTAAAAIGAGFATGGSAALAAAKVAFPACMATKGQQIADEYSLNVETLSYWTDWG